jgi:hypothetical protein
MFHKLLLQRPVLARGIKTISLEMRKEKDPPASSCDALKALHIGVNEKKWEFVSLERLRWECDCETTEDAKAMLAKVRNM